MVRHCCCALAESFRALHCRLPELDHAGRCRGSQWQQRLSGRKRALPPLCLLCLPLAHRTLIFRELKGLAPHIDVSVVHPDMLDEGWTFSTDFAGATGDTLYGLAFLREIYTKADPGVSGARHRAHPLGQGARDGLANESSEIIRMFDAASTAITGGSDELWPADLRDAIAPINARIYDTLNNGVYKPGSPPARRLTTRPWCPCSRRWTGWRRTRAQPLAAGRSADRGGLAAVHDAGALRSGLPPALQVQSAADHRLSEPLGLHPRALPDPGRRGHRAVGPHRAALPLQPRLDQSARIIPINPVLDFDAPHGR